MNATENYYGKTRILVIDDERLIRMTLGAKLRLIAQGATVVVIEHDLDVIGAADWVVDMGPGGGEEGGRVVYQGAPEGLVRCRESLTGKWLGKRTGR